MHATLSSSTVIDEADLADVEVLAAIIGQANQDVRQRFNLTIDNCPTHPSFIRPHHVATGMERGERYFILKHEHAPAGCVGLANKRPGIADIKRLAVLPEYRRRGYGESLMRFAVELARGEGGIFAEIAIIADHHELQRWYEDLGFRTIDTRTYDHLPFKVTHLSLRLR